MVKRIVFFGSMMKTVRIYQNDLALLLAPETNTSASTHSERQSLGIPVGSVLFVQHIIERGDLSFTVGDLRNIISGMIVTSWHRYHTMGNSTDVGANLEPHSLMSSTHFLWSSKPLAEIPITFTLRLAKSGALSANISGYVIGIYIRIRTSSRLRRAQ